MGKRIIGVFCVMTLLMTFAMYRIYYIDVSDYLAVAAAGQGKYRLEVANSRGQIYDRNFEILVNNETSLVAAILPTPASAAALLEPLEGEEREALLERLEGALPFIINVTDLGLYADGIDIFRVPVRYSGTKLAPHIIGYISGDSKDGLAGIEKAYDALLKQEGGEIWASYEMDAAGRAMQGTSVTIERTGEDTTGGVVLTLDKDMQRIVEEALEAGVSSGAAVVMDISTGDILAMASLPLFDQNDIAASLDSEDAPFINRAISGYNIGSVFKLIVSAAALESGYSRYHTYECQGYVDIGGQVFRCNNNAVHGSCDMERALQVSCNTYFIDLASQMGYGNILALCENLGMGTAVELAPGFYTQGGNLPGREELRYPAGLANFSFGQGSSLATPLQFAQAVAVLAGGGGSVTPRLVLGTTQDGQTLQEQAPSYASNQIISARTSEIMRELMVSVIAEGSGRRAQPLRGGAGGKTSSAQTGQMVEQEDGEEKEIVHAWFAGFFPAQSPKYSVVIFCEGGESGELVAAPIFKEIADGIGALER